MHTPLRLASLALVPFVVSVSFAADDLRLAAIDAMERAVRYFRTEVAYRGGYLWKYKSDFTVQEGEGAASPTMVWVQPPGTPAVGLVMLEAWEATDDRYFLDGAVAAAEVLVWGQLASGGWDRLINFEPEESERWHYRRDVLAGDTDKGRRRNSSLLDDNMTQSALMLLMRVDETLQFNRPDFQGAIRAGLQALLDVQYPNGAWPQHFEAPPDPAKFPVRPARYPASWTRVFPGTRYYGFYTFNDGCMTDAMGVMLEAHRIYGDARYLEAAKRLDEFILLAQMPEPQPVWAQQYNPNMEPAWARRFEPPSVTGGEIRDILEALLDLHVATGEERFLAPFPAALAWMERSRLPDGRLARFYELYTNRPLYFTKNYVLTFDDSDLPTHYGFKADAAWVPALAAEYRRLRAGERAAVAADRQRVSQPSASAIRAILAALDVQGRWLERGRLRRPGERTGSVEAEILSSATFNRNVALLARYVKAAGRKP
jgi:hypothetical protein